MNNFDKLEQVIKTRVPEFEIKYKEESNFMKLLNKILFFNKRFMEFTTTIGKKVYFTNKKKIEENPNSCFITLAHEYVHVIDGMNEPLFKLKYLFPQILSVFSLFSFLSFFSLWFLLFLTFLLFLLPIPAPFRTKSEIRGYGMTLFVEKKLNYDYEVDLKYIVDKFVNADYYFMSRNKKYVEKELREYLDTDKCLNDKTPVYAEVLNILNEKI